VTARSIYLRTGPFVTHLETANERLHEGIALLYDAPCVVESSPFSDFHVVVRSSMLRRYVRPKVAFYFEGTQLFRPSPWAHGLHLFEWGLNWVIASTANQYLAVHAAVVERGGCAMILPGLPGSGKSTLAAALAYRGWRLLSDELTLIEPETGQVVGLARPISLKNRSIGLIRDFAPEAVLSRAAEGTIKGTVALAKAPGDSIRRVAETAAPAWIVFLNLQPGTPAHLTNRPKAECFIELAANAMNYNVLGERGFDLLAQVVDRSRCFEFTYGDLAEAVSVLTAMADEATSRQGQERWSAPATNSPSI
jgi:HprK-related kinase A